MIGKKNACLMWLIRQEEDSEWEVRPYRKARTHQQNAYYWALLTQVADRMRISKTEAHNRMLRDYGQLEIVAGEVLYVMLPDTDAGEKDALRSETYHLRPTSQVRPGDGDHGYRAYQLLRGSSSYNTAEMSVLLDGLIQEAKNLGIETATPDEIARMREEDRRHERRRRQRDPA